MSYVFFALLAILVIALGINLTEINPYQKEDAPMLDQIEAFLFASSHDEDKWNSLDLAA